MSSDTWTEKKKEHLALSAAAAEVYDELYENANFATGSYMRYELEVIERFVKQAPSTTYAVDLGCGTGRDSFVLAKYFDQVYSCDFSLDMIRVAKANKLKRKNAGHIQFEVVDVEDGPLTLADNSVSFLNTGFGMASFVKNLDYLFREVRRILQPRGIAIFSFYNAAALVNQLKLEWKPALAARVIEGEDALEVSFDRTYRIPAKAYQPNEVKKRAEGNFKLIELTTFPTLSALFPQSLFENAQTRELCRNVDQLLAANISLAAGPYIVAVCQKGGPSYKEQPVTGYERVLQLLRLHKITADIRSHSPVRTMDDVREVLDAPVDHLVKSVLVAIVEDTETDELSSRLFLFGVPANRKIHLGKIASLLDTPREKIRMATQIEVEELTGFQVGSIPPFGLPTNIHVILDSTLETMDRVWCGTGKSTESLRISMDNLKKLSACSFFDISKPLSE